MNERLLYFLSSNLFSEKDADKWSQSRSYKKRLCSFWAVNLNQCHFLWNVCSCIAPSVLILADEHVCEQVFTWSSICSVIPCHIVFICFIRNTFLVAPDITLDPKVYRHLVLATSLRISSNMFMFYFFIMEEIFF